MTKGVSIRRATGSVAFVLAALTAGICWAGQAGASVYIPEGPRVSWDSEPRFVDTNGGGRIFFSRKSEGPGVFGPYGGGPFQRLMYTTDDGSYTAPLTTPDIGEKDFQIATPTFTDRIVFTQEKAVTGDTSRSICVQGIYFVGATMTCPVTSLPDHVSDPAFSPDGTRVAFVRNSAVYIFNVNSPAPVRLTPVPPSGTSEASSPVFSGDGTRLVYEVSGSIGGQNQDGLWMVPADGSTAPVRLTGTTNETACYTDSAPVWRPVVNRFVFVRNTPTCAMSGAGVWQVDPAAPWVDATWPQGTQLVMGNGADAEFGEPTTSVDGEMIAYTRKRAELPVHTVIHVFDSQGDRALSTIPPAYSVLVDSHPTISKDKRYVAFARDAEPYQVSMRSGIYRIDSDGTGLKQLTKSYDYYEEGRDSGFTGPKGARLRIRARPKSITVKAGRNKGFDVAIRNVGGVAARHVELCVSGPGPEIARYRRGCIKKWRAVEDGTGVLLKTGIRIQPGVKPGRQFRLKFKVSAQNVRAKTSVLRVRVK